jgi:hypothetical protein
MTRPLRRLHLRIWIALAILLPVVLLAGIAGRQDTTPINDAIAWEQLK